MKRSNIKTFIKVGLVAGLLMFLGTVQVNAQRVALVDIEQILAAVPDYQKAQQELDGLAARWRQEIAQQYDVIKGMYNKYQAEQVLLSDNARRQREEEIMAKEKSVQDLQKNRFGPEGALFEQRRALVQPIQDRVYAAIEKYATDKGYDIILDKSGTAGVIFSKTAFDKTDDIIKMLQ
ncbi:MAG: OmpH family outer membrane protein [Bacteroidota bacterium]